MFTGLIEDIGRIERIVRHRDAIALTITTSKLPVDELALGDSVAVAGVCLTVTESGRGRFSALVGNESLAKTILGELQVGGSVNLERALRIGDRLGGHMVSGHVDGVGHVMRKRTLSANLDIEIETPTALLRYIVVKGSVAVDGISLTVNRVNARGFAVALIPHTVDETTLAQTAVGSKLNIEVDMIGKYVEKLVAGYHS